MLSRLSQSSPRFFFFAGVYVLHCLLRDGGSMGALLPGFAWDAAGWPACVAMVLAIMTVIAALAYRRVAA